MKRLKKANHMWNSNVVPSVVEIVFPNKASAQTGCRILNEISLNEGGLVRKEVSIKIDPLDLPEVLHQMDEVEFEYELID